MTLEPADRVDAVPPSGIRRFFELAEEMDDIISLGVGEPDFSAPWAAREAAITSLERGQTSYTANKGKRELRERISRFESAQHDLDYDPDEEMVVTAGASEGLDLAFRALLNPGDKLAVAQPCYVSYVPGATFASVDVVDVPTRVEDEFKLTREVLEQSGAAEADALVYCYPNNPTGATMTGDELREVAAFCREHDLAVFADEIYADLTYEHDHTSIATLPGMRERTIVFNGFSKAFAMTGFRLGYAMGPEDAITAMNRIHQYTMLSAPTTAQHAAIEALDSCLDEVQEMTAQYDRRRNYVLSRFEDMGISCFPASGAFYAFPECPWDDADEFAEALLQEEKVAVVPGTAFGEGGDGHLRVSYATGLDDLKTAMNRIESFIS
ncbi:pyridoxal phosphate-dependent aminotransferase [Haloarcula salinisoli]|uniref:Aminotransferase n=1 Tax=Haloarcula salinisoli TaxID=2487746 RepID=A0A8J7YD10_9EURY|nr:aminotransferase class I/II-fold pyridoxal phosphate-dependent enzyme [Halomicroarcula salinisoli]MBX0284857.1 aminotransferase class I/II-fold pyridoxal phosphate-dependent enzyme [Halomicroarcula salinisoli]MBX0303665.1 aminotransferase class I/II-fold pyridoxal phosphate-dependent enzyme [Halomicroarcula salinisoli]